MFYAHFVLAKKGPLARIWLAAHWDKKLTKAHVFETNIESSVEGILQPKVGTYVRTESSTNFKLTMKIVKMALRTSGHLLLGIVRIYSRKAKYLLADCNEAFIKIKIAFRPGVVDLPEGNREAAVAAITLPEVFHDFDTAMPDITIDMDAQVSLNQSRAEDITLKEDYGNLSLMADDGFDDLGFDEPEGARDATNIEDFDHTSLLLGTENPMEMQQEEAATAQANTSGSSTITKPCLSLDAPLKDDGFGGTIGEGLLDGATGALFEPAGLFDDAPLGPVPEPTTTTTADEPSTSQVQEPPPVEKPAEEQQEDDSDDDMYDMAPGSMGAPSPPSSPESPSPPDAPIATEKCATPERPPVEIGDELRVAEPEPLAPVPSPVQNFNENSVPDMPPPPVPPPPVLEHTTLINNDAESFALAPLDATIVHGVERTVKTKRKRKLIVDEVKSISGEEMKTQLSDTTDIVATLDLAPPTKRLMHWKETGGVEKLFALPGYPILSKTLSKGYARHLTTRSVDNENFFKDDSDAEIEQGRDEEASGSRKRRRLSDRLGSTDLLPLDSLHLDSTRPSYSNDPGLSHPSLDVSNFFEPQHPLFPPVPQLADQQQMMAQPDHVMQQILNNELQQLPHIPHIMDSMVQGPPLDSLPPVLPDVSLPEPIPPPPPPMQQTDMSHSLLEPFQEANTVPEDRCIEDSVTQPFMNGQKIQNAVTDDEATQICPQNQYQQNQAAEVEPILPEVQPQAEVETPAVVPTAILDQTSNQVATTSRPSESNDLFDSLISDFQPPQPAQNHVAESEVQQNKDTEEAVSDDDDYGAPASVGPVVPDEQMADETYEQFEERILTKRTTHLLHCIHNRLETHNQVSFGDLVKNNKRKQVAQKFYTFLVLKKQQAVELEQDSTYGDLVITKGPKYNMAYNGN